MVSAYADDFKYNYTEVRLFKGFVKISAEGAQQLSIIHCQLSICDKIAKSGFIDKLKGRIMRPFHYPIGLFFIYSSRISDASSTIFAQGRVL